jgi:branched-subunit amino acid ABC-type transport system permease component
LKRGARCAAALLLACGLCLLAGCGALVDPGEARLCRALIAGLNPGESRLKIISTRALPPSTEAGAGARTSGLAMWYEVWSQPFAVRRRYLACEFLREREGVATARHLVGVTSDGDVFGPARIYVARRYWLETAEGSAADPEPIAGLGSVPSTSRPVAIALQTVFAGLPQTSIYILLALAVALVQGLAGRTNLAYGEIAALGGYGAALGVAAAGGSGTPLAAIAVGLLLGVWTAGIFAGLAGRIVFAPLAACEGQAGLAASLAVALVLGETARLAQGPGARSTSPLLDQPQALARAGDYVVTVTPMTLLASALALGLAVAILAGMRRSSFGRSWRAAADDPLAAALAGIDLGRLALATFALAGAVAGLAGALVTLAAGGATHNTGLVLGLKAVIAAILGGSGSLAGAATAGLSIGLTEALWSAVLPIEHRDAAIFVLIVGLLVVRPGGLAGAPDLERRG